MLTSNLVLCGCSLGESWMPYFDGQTRKTDSNPDNRYEFGNWKKVTRIQQSGGTHGLMLYKLLNYFLVNEANDTTIVVQLTGYQRPSLVNQYPFIGENKSYLVSTFQNSITDRDEFVICGTKAVDPWTHLSGEADTESLISVICMLSKLGAKVYAFRGWPGICSPDEWNRTNTMLKDAGVTTTDLDYLTLAYNSKTNDWLDDKHPGVKLGCESFDKIWKAIK